MRSPRPRADARIELALACDVRLAAPDPTFAQLESMRGVFPFGGDTAAAQALRPEIRRLMATEDAEEGIRALLERRQPSFRGR